MRIRARTAVVVASIMCVALSADSADAGRRRRCRRACGDAIARCVEKGGKPRACRRRTLRRCRRVGVATCTVLPPTTTTLPLTTPTTATTTTPATTLPSPYPLVAGRWHLSAETCEFSACGAADGPCPPQSTWWENPYVYVFLQDHAALNVANHPNGQGPGPSPFSFGSFTDLTHFELSWGSGSGYAGGWTTLTATVESEVRLRAHDHYCWTQIAKWCCVDRTGTMSRVP